VGFLLGSIFQFGDDDIMELCITIHLVINKNLRVNAFLYFHFCISRSNTLLFSVVCFIFSFMYIMIVFDLLGTLLVCLYAFGNLFCNTPNYKKGSLLYTNLFTLFTILTLQNK